MEESKKNKLNIPTAIVLGCLILGGAFYAIQVNKQKSIEKQQQIELEAEKEQENKEYIAKRKLDCLAFYKAESDKFNNIESWRYIEPVSLRKDSESGLNLSALLPPSDKCEISYRNNQYNEAVCEGKLETYYDYRNNTKYKNIVRGWIPECNMYFTKEF